MFDLENFRNEELIRERQSYENEFIILEDIEKSDEMDLQISFYANDDLCYEYEPYDLARDELLIKEREAYEMDFIPDLEFEMFDTSIQEHYEYLIENHFSEIDLVEEFESDALDYAISQYEAETNYDFEDYFECYNDYDYVDYEACYEADRLRGYVPSNDPFDSLDGCDYPEGPNENLEGFRYPEDSECFFFCDYDEPDFEYVDYGEIQAEIYLTERYESINNEEIYMNQLIEEHLIEEKEFFDYARENEILNDESESGYTNDLIFIS